MASLREMLTGLGFKNVKTLLASGNIIFETEETDEPALVTSIENGILQTFGFEVKVMVRSWASIEAWVGLKPFEDIEVDKDTRLYVTIFGEKLTTDLQIPYQSSDGSYRILQQTARELFSVLQLSSKVRTTDAMKIIKKESNQDGTTRNWNTIKRMMALVEK